MHRTVEQESHLQDSLHLRLPYSECHHVVRGVADFVVLQEHLPDKVDITAAAHGAEVRLECAAALRERLAGDDARPDACELYGSSFLLGRQLDWHHHPIS